MKKLILVFCLLGIGCPAAQHGAADSAYGAAQLDCVAKQDAGTTKESKDAARAESRACRDWVDKEFGVSGGGK